MNKAYAFFCRAYQTVFRAALPILPYREPVQLDGLASIVPLLTEKEISSVLLVTDASVRALGLTGGLEDALKAASVACAVYDKTVPNPTIANIEEGRALYLSAHAQAIIAVGGGSVMDCAKIIGARIAKPRQPVQRMGGLLHILRRTPLLIAAPTTAGTGSETTLAAVITDSAAHHKYPINDFALIPDYAVLDPELTRGLPPMLTATTGMDALTHAIEAYIGCRRGRICSAPHTARACPSPAPTSAMSTAWPIRSAVNTACRTGWRTPSSSPIFSTLTAQPAIKSWAGSPASRTSPRKAPPTARLPRHSSAGFAR